MIYIDSNILIFARVDKGERGEACRQILERLENNQFVGITSFLTIDEVVWKVKKEINYQKAIEYGKSLVNSNIHFLPVNSKEILRGFELMEGGLDPRDAIHASTCLNHGIFSIITEDEDFKKIKELETFTPEEFLKKV